MLEEIKNLLEKQHYGIVGKHSTVQICRWTKKSLLDKGFCYKQKFYGIQSHECCQMSPTAIFCFNRCLHCWRAIEYTYTKMKELDKPSKIINGCIEKQRKLLSGFKGNSNVNMKKFIEAQEPKHFAISLIGEPMIYPYIGELIEQLEKRKKTTFLVTNGLLPKKLLEIQKTKLPTQIYISMNAPTKSLYDKICRPLVKKAWEKFNCSLELFPKLDTRKVIRLTLVRNLNMARPESYARLIKKAMPDFVEIKAFMSVGYARKRLGYERMPSHSEIKEFAKKLSLLLKYKILDEKKESRVVLLGKKKEEMKIIKK